MIIRQYLKFFVNGGILGVISLGLQTIIYHAMGINSGLAYAVATALTYVPLIMVNFIIQRRWIFQREGLFWRFVAANLLIMFLVSLLSPLFRLLITWSAGAEWGDRGGFALAAIAMSIPSFFLKRLFVFNSKQV
jgi:putative flippase GtrA